MVNPLKIWHDPGHGGTNKGSEYSGLVERNWNLKIAHSLMGQLSGLDCLQQIARSFDETIPYNERAETAKGWHAQLAFLHHVNAMVYPEDHVFAGQPWEKYDGLMTFYLPEDGIAREVAEMIGHCAPVKLRQKKPHYAAVHYDWTRNAYHCLKNYEDVGISAVLIEWGFATSPIDREILLSQNYRSSLCAAAACGVGRAVELFNGG